MSIVSELISTFIVDIDVPLDRVRIVGRERILVVVGKCQHEVLFIPVTY